MLADDTQANPIPRFGRIEYIFQDEYVLVHHVIALIMLIFAGMNRNLSTLEPSYTESKQGWENLHLRTNCF